MSKQVIERLKKEFGDAIVETHSQFGDDTAVVRAESWHDAAVFLRNDSRCAMNMFVDLTAVDYLDRRSGDRFDVVLHLRSLERMHRVRLKARIGSATETNPEIASVTDVWRGADWFEREAWDMFGIKFVGHPDLRRILMYEEFEGHPLRKDYDVQRAQPLIPYRKEALDKLPPFGPSEGLPFGRQVHANRSLANGMVAPTHVGAGAGTDAAGTTAPDLNALGFVEDN